jgi:hypothetical protein
MGIRIRSAGAYLFLLVILFWSQVFCATLPFLILIFMAAGVLAQIMLKDLPVRTRLLLALFTAAAFKVAYGQIFRLAGTAGGAFFDDIPLRAIKAGILDNLTFIGPFPLIDLLAAALGLIIGHPLSCRKGAEGIVAVALLGGFLLNLGAASISLDSALLSDGRGSAGVPTADGHGLEKANAPGAAAPRVSEAHPQSIPRRSILTFRAPLIPMIAAALPPGDGPRALLFACLAMAFIIAAYLLVLREAGDPLTSLATPFILGSVYFYALAGAWNCAAEYWGWVIFGLFLWARQGRCRLLQIAALAFSMTASEMFFLHWLVLLTIALMRRDMDATSICLLGAAAPIIYHGARMIAGMSCWHGAAFLLTSPEQMTNRLHGGWTLPGGCGLLSSIAVPWPLLFMGILTTVHILASFKILRCRLELFIPLAILPLAVTAFLLCKAVPASSWSILTIPAMALVIPAAFTSRERPAQRYIRISTRRAGGADRKPLKEELLSCIVSETSASPAVRQAPDAAICRTVRKGLETARCD